MLSDSLPDADVNLPEMKTKSPSCPSGEVHMHTAPGDKVLMSTETSYHFVLSFANAKA